MESRHPRLIALAVVFSFAASSALVAGASKAEEDILTLSLAPEYAVAHNKADTWHGFGGQICASYGIDEYTSLEFPFGYDRLWNGDRGDRWANSIRFAAGAEYGLDATEFVPYLGAGIEGYLDQTGGSGFDVDLSVAITLGMDWIVTDTLLVGIFGGYHLLATDVDHLVASAGIRVGWRIDTL